MTLRSDAHAVYAKVLVDLYSVVDAIDSGLIDLRDQGMPRSASHCSRPAQYPPSGSHGRRSPTLGLGADAKSPSDKKLKPDGRLLSHQGNIGENRVAKGNRSKREKSKEVDCPDHKHHMMYRISQAPPCRGCREIYMSQVRYHLTRTDHRGRSGIWQCSCCKEEFDDQEEYETHQAAGACQYLRLRRRDIVLQWARLYLIRYPSATRIPIPCRLPGVLVVDLLKLYSL
jgi:ribosomal protein L37AE/L43A